MNLEVLISEKWWKEWINKYIIELTDELAKKVEWINNIESEETVWIYMGGLLFYERPKNYKEIESKVLNQLLNNLFDNQDEEEYFSWLYKLYLLLQKYADWNNRVWLLLKMALNKKSDFGQYITEFENNKNLPPKLEVLINWINNFANYYIRIDLLGKFWNVGFEEKKLDDYIKKVIDEFNNWLSLKTPEYILEKLSEFLKVDSNLIKEEFINFIIFDKDNK